MNRIILTFRFKPTRPVDALSDTTMSYGAVSEDVKANKRIFRHEI